MDPVYRPVIGLAVTLFKAMGWDVAVQGAERVPRTGPAVLASNHVSYLDFIVVGYGALPQGRLVRFLAKQEIFDHPVAGPLMRGMKHIPVDRHRRPTLALDAAVAALRRGEVIGMFPEGTISRSFVPLRGQTGAARMAMAAGAPLVPTAVWGPQRILTKGRDRNVQRRVPMRVAYGAPVPYGADDEPRAVTDRLMAAIRQLVAAQQAAYPDQPARPDDAWWVPAHLGGTAPTPEQVEAELREAARRRRRRRAEQRRRDNQDS